MNCPKAPMTTNTIELLDQAYAALHAQGLTASKADFSMSWLGRAPSYLTSMRARNREVSPKVLDYFYKRLERHAERFGQLIYTPYASDLQTKSTRSFNFSAKLVPTMPGR